MKTSEDHRRRQREKLPTWRQATTLGHDYVRCCHVGQSRFGQTPLEAGIRQGGDEAGYKGREEGGKEQRRGAEKEKREGERGKSQRKKTDHKVARAGEPDSMPRLAIEEKKMEEARRDVIGRRVRRKVTGRNQRREGEVKEEEAMVRRKKREKEA